MVMPSLKHDNNDRPVAVSGSIYYLLYFAFTINHIGRIRCSISKMCVGCTSGDIQENEIQDIVKLLTTLLLLAMARVAECRT